MQAWTPFAASVGGAAAGLTGLTFIVVAFRFDTIAVSTEYRNRAAQALTLFVTVTITAALLCIPQPSPALGIELATAAILSATLLVRLDRAARQGTDATSEPELIAALTCFIGLIVAAGTLTGLGWEPGLHLYAPAALLGLGWGVYGAWIFLTGSGRSAMPD